MQPTQEISPKTSIKGGERLLLPLDQMSFFTEKKKNRLLKIIKISEQETNASLTSI